MSATDRDIYERLLSLCMEAGSDAGNVLANTVDAVLDLLAEAEAESQTVPISAVRGVIAEKLAAGAVVVDSEVVGRAREVWDAERVGGFMSSLALPSGDASASAPERADGG